MVNSLDIAALNQFGIDRKSPLEMRRKAGFLFSQARSRGAWRSFWHKLSGKENSLQDLTEVAKDTKKMLAQHLNLVLDPRTMLLETGVGVKP